MPVRVTLKQVAEHCGVSIAAVSYALNREPSRCGLAPTTRNRIRASADHLGYVGSWTARALQARRSHLIGLIHTSADERINSFHARMIHACSNHLAVRGYDLVLVPIAQRTGWEERIADRRLDAALALHAIPERCAQACDQVDLPLVFLNAPGPDGGPTHGRHHLLFDDRAVVRCALDHLAASGHRRIAYLGRERSRQHHGSERLRENAYRAWCDRSGREALVCDGYRRCAPGWAADSLRRPDAVLCYADNQAVQLIQLLHELGLHVPRDLSVMGIDDSDSARWSIPRLSSVALPVDALCARAAELALALIDDPAHAPVVERFAGELVLRASSSGLFLRCDRR